MALNDWLKREAACPVENTIPDLEKLLERGYTTVIFHATGDSCEQCKKHDNEEILLAEFMKLGADYEAPIYSLTHCGCKDSIEVTGPNLDSVIMNYTGIIH